MKRKFLNIISCFLALFIFVGSFLFCVPSLVSAAGTLIDPPVTSGFYPASNSGSVSEALAKKIYNAFAKNPHLSDLGITGDFVIFIHKYNDSDSGSIQISGFDYCYSCGYSQVFSSSSSSIIYSFISSTAISESNLANFETMNFSVQSVSPVDGQYGGVIRNTAANNIFIVADVTYINNSVTSPQYNRPYSAAFSFGSFNPDYELTGVITGFDFSVDAFVQWLIDTDKYLELPAYIGLSKLSSFVSFYKDWGSSNSTFVSKIVEWFSYSNIASQSIENRNILKSTIDRLYQEYCNQAYVTIQHDSSRLPHHRRNIETVTTDDDLTLVTDDVNDDIYTLLLRDILRGVISIPGQIYNCTEMIISKLDYLNWNVTVSNGGGSSGSDLTPVINKMDDIIDKLEADTVSVEIDQTTKDDTDDFFDDWNLEFSTALNNKFPVASQLRTFFTGFFERCGIDADSDGEVYQYYNPGVLTASSVSRSVGSSSEADIVSDFLGKFDNSDPTFLDDASFQGVPDLSVSVGGHSVSLIDFRVYAKYRDKIHFIISFVIWTLYLLHLYKALPSIIGQVADVAVKTSDL